MKYWWLFSIILFVACGQYPKDPEGSLKKIEQGNLRVGISHQPPYTLVADTSYSGTEVEIIEAYAAKKQAHLIWIPGSETVLAEKLKNFDLDIMISGLVKESPIIEGLGHTQSYYEDHFGKHVIATAPGENALLADLDAFLEKYKTQ